MGYLLLVLGTIGWHAGMFGMFKKAGMNPMFALIPFYNTWLIAEKCEIKKTWFWIQLIPIAGQFVTIWITLIFVMHFKRFNIIHHSLATFLPFLYFPYIGWNKEDKWYGKDVVVAYRKTPTREWIDAGVFAVVAATIIRTFVFEAYVIPTGSMERTLLINDFLFVSKMSYGPRIPVTPISFPFVHNTMPGSITTPSYTKAIQVPYTRMPGYVEVKRNDVVVFNFPAGDTIINLPDFGSKMPYYDVLRGAYKGDRDALMAAYPILVHPYDKTDNYIKRCVAVGGDKLEVRKGILYINDAIGYHPSGSQTDYELSLSAPFTDDFLEKDLGIKIAVDDEHNGRYNKEKDYEETNSHGVNCMLNLTSENYQKVKAQPNVKSIQPIINDGTDENMFPNDTTNKKWNVDNYGPIVIPKKGVPINLTPENIALYKRLITNYENNSFSESAPGKYVINGVATNTYTPKYNYYWMMGDNRHRSQDSRYWGYVPETHVVGKASLIWFSWSDGPRWKRIFSLIK